MELIFGPEEAHGVSKMDQKSPGLPTRVGGTPTPQGAPCLVDSSGLFWPTLLLRGLLLVHKKSSKIGTLVGLRLVFLFYKTQKQEKNRNWHWALG